MSDWPVAGFTSTGSKHPRVLYGDPDPPEAPLRMSRSEGCRVWDPDGKEYIDCIMALGAVALGYGHPVVRLAAAAALDAGVVGSLAPTVEAELAEDLRRLMPRIKQVRFLKSGAEACAAAIRLARAHTGRDRVLGCGYHGWLDWTASGPGVPAATSSLYGLVPFNDAAETRRLIRKAGDRLACVIVEPVIGAAPDPEWLATLRAETTRVGALWIIDEIKTACRLAIGGATERYHLDPDLMVLGKALANGFPLAAVGGREDVMAQVANTWISSTLATEFLSLAAARACLDVMKQENVPATLHKVGSDLLAGLGRLASEYPDLVTRVVGISEMCHLEFRDADVSRAVAIGAASRGVLFKRSAYNFVSLAHDRPVVHQVIDTVAEVLRDIRG